LQQQARTAPGLPAVGPHRTGCSARCM